MSKNRSSVSKAQSYKEIGEFWDTHDLADYWDQTEPAEFEVDIQSEVTYYAVDNELSTKIHSSKLVAARKATRAEDLRRRKKASLKGRHAR